jgi:YhcH/YjgK/YiaL family protein
MILDHLDCLPQYAPLHPLFQRAIEFLRATDLAALPLGRHAIEGERLFAIAARDAARPREQARLEAHRQHIDIQAVLAGTDHMGWKPRARCSQPDGAYDPAKDIEFFRDPPDAWLPVAAGGFALFFPSDAHAPLIGRGPLHKVIVKVAVD